MRKLLCLLTLAAAAAAIVAAQDKASPAPPRPPGLIVGNPTWADVHIVIAYGNYGGGRPRGATRDDSSRAQDDSSALTEEQACASAGKSAAERPATWRAASAKLTNAGAKEIKSVRLDFVFADAQSGAEVLRLSLHEKKRLRAGETRRLSKPVQATKTNRRGDGARMCVEFKEVVYADGSVWTPGG
jgi:hypothetical protein